MKKITLALVFILICQFSIAGNNVDKMFSRFSDEKGTTSISVGGFMMAFVKPFVKELKGIKSVKILSLEDCSPSVKKDFEEQISKLKYDGYETLIRSNEENEETRIMVKIENEAIKEVLIVTTGNDPALIRVKGNIKQSDIEKWAKK